ncbi:MAG TPA: DUF1573 domain-containing protein [Candidatus Paceibacterota bacterium]
MKTKSTLIALLICFAIIGLLLWGYSKNVIKESSSRDSLQANLSQSLLTAIETIYDFGEISMKNGNVNKEFIIKNPTDKDINLKTVVTSCMCTSAFIIRQGYEKGPFKMPGMGYVPPANEIIKAGESIKIKVVYDPNAHGPAGVGPIDRFIYLSDSGGGKIELEIKALVKP